MLIVIAPMKKILPILTVMMLLAIVSCNSATQDTDALANQMLIQSRQLLESHQYDAARDTILSMRKRYPTAIQARAQGILLLDSIEIFAACDSLTTATGEEWKRLDMKQRFFERKLQEDLK